MRTLRGLLWAELGVPGANVGGGDLLDFGLAEVWKNQPLKLALVEFASPGRQSPALNIVERVIAEASQCLPAEAGGRGRLPATAADGPLHGRKPGLRIDSGAERVRGAVKLPIWPEVASSEIVWTGGERYVQSRVAGVAPGWLGALSAFLWTTSCLIRVLT